MTNPPSEVKCCEKCSAILYRGSGRAGVIDTMAIPYCSNSACECHTKKVNQSEGWDNGILTFDDVRNILDVCNVKDVETWSEGLTVSFVPKNVTGKVWKELKEKMHLIGDESLGSHKSIDG